MFYCSFGYVRTCKFPIRPCQVPQYCAETAGPVWSWWRGKRSWHSRCMRNSQFHVSGKRPMKYMGSHTCSIWGLRNDKKCKWLHHCIGLVLNGSSHIQGALTNFWWTSQSGGQVISTTSRLHTAKSLIPGACVKALLWCTKITHANNHSRYNTVIFIFLNGNNIVHPKYHYTQYVSYLKVV